MTDQAAQTPQQPHQQPNAPGVDSGAIGRLTEAERDELRRLVHICTYDCTPDRCSIDESDCVVADAVAEKISAHVTAALAEVESQIALSVSPGFGMRHDGTEDPQAMAYVDGLHDAHDIVRDYREGVGR